MVENTMSARFKNRAGHKLDFKLAYDKNGNEITPKGTVYVKNGYLAAPSGKPQLPSESKMAYLKQTFVVNGKKKTRYRLIKLVNYSRSEASSKNWDKMSDTKRQKALANLSRGRKIGKAVKAGRKVTKARAKAKRVKGTKKAQKEADISVAEALEVAEKILDKRKRRIMAAKASRR